VGWYVLLDRPTNRSKIMAGTVMVGLLFLAGILRTVLATPGAA
jgi:hypothetical protein